MRRETDNNVKITAKGAGAADSLRRMSEDFARVTAVDKIAEGRYEGCIDEGWDIGGVPNGGYVLAIAARAMAESVGRPPLSVTAHYLATTRPGPCSVVVEPVRVGRRMATLTAMLGQEGRESLRVLGTFGGSSGADPLLVDGMPPDLPPYADCVAAPAPQPAGTAGQSRDGSPAQTAEGAGRNQADSPVAAGEATGSGQADTQIEVGGAAGRSQAGAPVQAGEEAGRSRKLVPAGMSAWPAIFDRLAIRWRPGDAAFMHGRPTGRAEVAGWFAFPDGAPIDAVGLLLVADAFAPPVFNIGLGPGWVPTLELTVHIRAVPAPGPLRCVFRTRYVQGGLLSEDGEMWDEAGVLVAQSRQLALTPRMSSGRAPAGTTPWLGWM